ncbi:hypothetical protein ACLB1M_15050 [Escherichia coli]
MAARDLVIFGAKGDLARRKLLPSRINWKKPAQETGHPDYLRRAC